MNKTYFIFVALFALSASSCFYDNEIELYGEDECIELDVSYSQGVLVILENSCYQCHNEASQFGGINLEGHANVLPFALSGSLLGSIKHESGFSPMPQDRDQLSSCKIDIIEQWINAGAPDN